MTSAADATMVSYNRDEWRGGGVALFVRWGFLVLNNSNYFCAFGFPFVNK
jgi:hypothetical protein